MRVTEAFQTLPNFLLLLVLVAVFGSDMRTSRSPSAWSPGRRRRG